jgi:hypothetical protein
LMVASYSFSDTPINDAIVAGLEKDLELFVIDPAASDPDGDAVEAWSPGRRPAFRPRAISLSTTSAPS